MAARNPDPLRKVARRVNERFDPAYPADRGEVVPVVYGGISSRAGLEFPLLFLPESKAQWLAQLLAALRCRTWGEFEKLCPAETYAEVRNEHRITLAEFSPELFDEDGEDGGLHPLPDDPLDLGGRLDDGNWPPSRRWLMLTTLPSSILSKYLVVVDCWDCAFGEVPAEHEAALVAELEEAGFPCRRDDDLIDATWNDRWGD